MAGGHIIRNQNVTNAPALASYTIVYVGKNHMLFAGGTDISKDHAWVRIFQWYKLLSIFNNADNSPHIVEQYSNKPVLCWRACRNFHFDGICYEIARSMLITH